MLVTTDEIKAAWLSPSRQLSIRVTMNDVTYGSEDITSLSFDSGSISGEVFQIGSTYMNSVRIIFPSIIETVDEDLEVIPELGVMVNGDFKYTKLGHFFIDEFERNRNSNTTSITATDKMRFMEGKYESKLSYPKSYKEVAIEVANLSGCEINQVSFASLGNGSINKPEGYTHRQAIGLIAQFEGGFASFNRNGELEIRRLAPTTFEITPESYMLKGFTKNEVSYRIGGITVKTGDEETDVIRVGSTNGSQVELENKVMTQTLLNHMWDLVKTLNYFPYELKWRGCPPLEAGDWIYVIATDGTKYSVPNLSYSINFSGGMTAESKAATNSSSQATYKYRGTLNQRVDTVESILGSNNWNTNYYDQTEPPYPKEGDIWFKPNGSDTEIWVYKNVNGKLDWVKEISSAPDESIQQAIDEMQKDLDDSIIVIEQAVENANQAVAKVDSMDKAINTALEQSANALDQAQQAIKDANDLLETVTEVQGTITNISAVVDEINNQLAVKVSQTDFDRLRGTVDTQAVQILANTREIELKASQSSVDTITGNIESIQSELSVQAGSITAINTRVDGQQTQIGTLQSSYSGLSSTIANVQNDFDNLQVGGRNYIPLSSLRDNESLASFSSSFSKVELIDGDSTRLTFSNYVGSRAFLSKKQALSLSNLSKDDKITLSIEIYIESIPSVTGSSFFIRWFKSDGTMAGDSPNVVIEPSLTTNKWHKLFLSAKPNPNADMTKSVQVTFAMQGNGVVRVRNMKLERGTKATDWTPAPEDMATITEMSNITQTVKDIQLTVADKVSQAQFTILSNQVTTTVSDIADLINKFPDPDFKKQNPKPTVEGTGIQIVYDSQGMTINNNGGTTKNRAYWGSPPLSLEIGKSYNIKMFVNVGASSGGKPIEVGTGEGENFTFSLPDTNPVWISGTIKLTKWTGLSFWLPPASAIKIRQLYIYEANTNVTSSQITQLSDSINLRVSKNDVVNQINISTEGVLIAGKKIQITGETYIENGVIKSAQIADGAITNAKIANATISSAKIITLDASKITANDLSVITANTRTLNVTGWINVTTDNRGIRGTYDFGDGYGEAFNYRWFEGDYRLSHRHLVYTGKIYNVNSNNTRGSYLYDGETFFGNDYLKMRQYNSSGTLLNRTDINANQITMSKGNWGNDSTVVLRSDGTSYLGGNMIINGEIEMTGGRSLNTTYINSASAGANINFNAHRTELADFRVGKDGSSNNGGRVVLSKAVYNRTYSNAANMVVTADGVLGRSTSARKYKTDITTATEVVDKAKKVLVINPASWYDKGELADGVARNRYYGFIADEFDECGLKEVVIYGADGQVESLAYDRITMYHNVILTEHEKEINQLKKQVSTLENQVRVLQAR